MKTTTVAGTVIRTSPRDETPVQQLAELRATLRGRWGPGASDEEVTDHTRDRPWLGAVPAPVERALVQRQTEQLRAAELIVNRRVLRRERSRSRRAAILGAVVALAVRAVTVRLARRGRQ